MVRPPMLEAAYKNKLERSIAEQLEVASVPFGYETLKLTVQYPPRTGKYTPDFICEQSHIIIEGKGYFYDGAADRQKLVLVKEQHPEWDIRICFSSGSKPIYKGSKTTYGDWADDHGIKWCDQGRLPASWLKEMKG